MLAVGFAAGPAADAVSALEPEEAKKKALEQLDDMFRGRRWLKGGGCTGKGDWEGQGGDGIEHKGGDDLRHTSQAEGVCRKTAESNPGRDELRGRNGERAHEPEEREHDRNSRDEPGPRQPAHGDWDRADGGRIDEAKANEEGEGAAGLPSAAYTGGLVHDWVRDEPFVRGGYSYPRFGFDEKTHADAAASVNGRLFFAGEHTNTPTGMTVHAAIDSGER